MRNILATFACVFCGINAWSVETSGNDKYSVSFNYQLNVTNPAGDFPSSIINLTVSPSLIRDDIHEYGGSLSYSVNKTENTILGTKNETSTTSLSGFYRYNLPIGDANAKNPLIGYFGPQVGITSTKAGNTSASNLSAGAQVGLNMMLSQNVAINFHILQFDTVFATQTQLLLTQSVGVKYYF